MEKPAHALTGSAGGGGKQVQRAGSSFTRPLFLIEIGDINMKIIDEENCYEQSDLDENFRQIINQAKEIWTQRIQEYIEKHGQKSYSSAIGSGIMVPYLPPRHKTPKQMRIIDPDNLVPPPRYPNNVAVWQGSAKEIVDFLKSKGIYCSYYPGIDD